MPEETMSRSIAAASPIASSSRALGERRRDASVAPSPAIATRQNRYDHGGARAGGSARSIERIVRPPARRACPCLGGAVFFNQSAAFSPASSAGSKSCHRSIRHDGGNRMLVDKLRMTVTPKKNAEIVEPRHDTLQLHTVDQENRERRLLFAYVIEESVLKVLSAVSHALYCPAFALSFIGAPDRQPDLKPVSRDREHCAGQGSASRARRKAPGRTSGSLAASRSAFLPVSGSTRIDDQSRGSVPLPRSSLPVRQMTTR